jgi:hypothetical protein
VRPAVVHSSPSVATLPSSSVQQGADGAGSCRAENFVRASFLALPCSQPSLRSVVIPSPLFVLKPSNRSLLSRAMDRRWCNARPHERRLMGSRTALGCRLPYCFGRHSALADRSKTVMTPAAALASTVLAPYRRRPLTSLWIRRRSAPG